MDDEERIAEIKRELFGEGQDLLGPHQLDDPAHGWFAPIVPRGSRGGAAPYGWGETRVAAAENALMVWRSRNS